MKTVIDDCTVVTGWTAVGTAVVDFINEHPEKIADDLSGSLVLEFPGAIGDGVTKTVAVDISERDYVVLHLWSRLLRGNQFKVPSDFFYSLTLAGTNSAGAVSQTWYIPTWQNFGHVVVALPAGWLTVTQVTFSSLTSNPDYVVLSDIVAIRDDYPLDVLNGVIDGIKVGVGIFAANGIVLGTVSGNSGDSTIAFDWTHEYLERYSVIQISDGVHTETHQIDLDNEELRGFFSTYDGNRLLYTYVDATISILFPVELDKFQEEQASPAITVFVAAPEPKTLTTEVDQIEDSFTSGGGAAFRRAPMQVAYLVQISCMSRALYLQAVANRIIRWMLGKGRLWINGRAHDFVWDTPPQEQEPEVIDAVSQVSYTLEVRVREERDQRAVAVNVTADGITVDVAQGG